MQETTRCHASVQQKKNKEETEKNVGDRMDWDSRSSKSFIYIFAKKTYSSLLIFCEFVYEPSVSSWIRSFNSSEVAMKCRASTDLPLISEQICSCMRPNLSPLSSETIMTFK